MRVVRPVVTLPAFSLIVSLSGGPIRRTGRRRQYPGLDQVNVRIPRALAGKGEVPIALTVDGQKANAVTVSIR
ncbi:MAG: hypothetical protein AAB225_21270 [Acidobacteriota bacterium]|mgnify:CR=1 FL=1